MRESIRKEIEAIAPFDQLEIAMKNQALEWVNSGAALCRIEKPATPPKHLVSYFMLVDEDYLLLVDHINAKLWLPTGGHVEPGEHPRRTVIREAREELSVEADFLFQTPIFLTISDTVGLTARHTDVSLWYVLRGDRRNTLEFDRSEFNSLQWFQKDNLPLGRTDPYMQRFLSKLYP